MGGTQSLPTAMGQQTNDDLDYILDMAEADCRRTSPIDQTDQDPDQQKLQAYVDDYNRQNPESPISVEDIPDRSGLVGGASELAHGVKNAVVDQFPEDMARMYQGGDVKVDDDSYAQGIIDEQEKDRASRVMSRQVILGDKVNESLYQGPASVATSAVVGTGGAVAGGAAGSVVPGVGTTVGAMGGAFAATGPAFYRLAKNQFLHEMLDVAKQNDVNLTPETWEQIKEDIDEEATAFGAWEAGPEAVSQALTAGLFKGVGGKVFGKVAGLDKITQAISKRALTRVGAKLAGEIAEEEVTEYITYEGQEGIRQDMGLRQTDPTLGEFIDTQAGPVAVGSILQGGVHKVGSMAMGKQPEQVPTMDARPVSSQEAVQSMGGVAAPVGARIDPDAYPQAPDAGYSEEEINRQYEEDHTPTPEPFPQSGEAFGMGAPTVTPGQTTASAEPESMQYHDVPGYSASEVSEHFDKGLQQALKNGSPFPGPGQVFGMEQPTVTAPTIQVQNGLPAGQTQALPAGGPVVIPQPTEQTGYGPIPQGQHPTNAMGMPQGEEYSALPVGSPTIAMGQHSEPIEIYTPNFETVANEGKNYRPDFEMVNGGVPAVRQATSLATEEQIAQLANEAATSPVNDIPQPTEAEKKAGNYKLGHVKTMGLDISIENPAGSERSGTDRDGKPWSVQMQHHYGYIKGTEGKDKDHLDVFLKNGVEAEDIKSKSVFVVDQVNDDGSFDEHKILAGFENEQDARVGYLANYEEGWQGLGAISEMSADEFKAWTGKSRKTKQPVAYAEQKQEFSSVKFQPTTELGGAESAAVAASEDIPGDIYRKSDGTPYTKKAIRLVVGQKVKKGMNVEEVQLDDEGKAWGWREVVDEGPTMDEGAQDDIRKRLINAVPDGDNVGMMNYADTLIDDEGFSIDDVYEVIAQIDDEVQNGDIRGTEDGTQDLRGSDDRNSRDNDAGRRAKNTDGDPFPARGAEGQKVESSGDGKESVRLAEARKEIKSTADTGEGYNFNQGVFDHPWLFNVSDEEFDEIKREIEERHSQLMAEGYSEGLTNEDVDVKVVKYILEHPLDGKSLQDWPGLYKNLSKKFGQRFFKARENGGTPIDEIADELSSRGLFNGDADYLVEFLKSAKGVKDNRAEYGFESRPTPKKNIPKKNTKAVGDKKSLAAKENSIKDLGEKIGGARKDMSSPTGKRGRKVKDDRPAWRKRYIPMENLLNKGTWELFDTRTNRHLSRQSFPSESEAEKMLPLAVVGIKHSPRVNHQKEWEIIRKVSKYKRVIIQDGFKSREDALKYMAKHAVEIIETNTSIGEEILVKPENVYRSGVKRRTGNVKPEAFMDDFGFRGVEFGNWNNQAERQEVLNHAYDGLMDLADVIGVPMKALSLNGELALAFGARGHGLEGAKAHYEGNYGVINLTKMKGAGSLAHEWFHALDHYLGRLDGKASPEMLKNKKGHKVFKAKPPSKDYASHGFLWKSKAREQLQDAYTDLINTMMSKAERYVEDTKQAERFVGSARDNLKKRLETIRGNIVKERTWGRKKRAATEEELIEFDILVKQLLDGNHLQLSTMENKTSKGKSFSRFGSWRETNGILDALNDILLAVSGRNGFNSKREGPLNGVAKLIRSYADRIKMLDDARGGDKKTKRVPTSYLMESRKIDEGRVSDYWTTNHEMAARAFSAFVEDKIAQEGNESYFLSYGADNAFYRLFDIRPFPEGKERVSMNKAFENFFDVIETKETPQGIAFFSRAQAPSKSMSKKRVEAAVNTLQKQAKNAKPLIVVQHYHELPGLVRRQFERQGGGILEGVHDPYTETVYLVADNIGSQRRAVSLWMHEQGLHRGLRGLFGPREYVRMMNRIYLASGGNKAFREIADLYGLDLKDRQHRLLAAEEYLASIAEKVRLEKTLSSRAKKVWRSFVKAVAEWLRAHNVNIRLTEAEIALIVDDAIQWTINGPDGPGGGVRFSQGDPAIAFAKKDTGPAWETTEQAEDQLKGDTKAWSHQVDDFYAGRIKGTKSLSVGKASDVLRKLGVPDLPMIMEQRDLAKIIDKHELPLSAIKEIPAQMAQPVMVLKSATKADSYVVLTDMKHHGKSVMAAIHYDVKSQRIMVNRIASMYERADRWFVWQIENGNLIYIDKKKSLAWARTSRLQLPKVPTKRGKNKILTDNDIVKPGAEAKFSRAATGNDFADQLHNIATAQQGRTVQDIVAAPDTIDAAVDAEQGRTSEQVLEDIEETRSFATRLFKLRDEAIYQANRRTNLLQQKIQRLAGSVRKHKGVFAYSDVKDSAEARELDQAMLVARDALNNPEKEAEFRTWAEQRLSDSDISNEEKTKIRKQIKILDKAMSLTGEQREFLNGEIEAAFQEMGEKAKREGIIRELRDNYVRRIWDFPKGTKTVSGTASNHGFKVHTSASKQRTLETILDGWMAGYELKVNSLSNSFDQIATEVAAIEANKAFIRIGRETVDAAGQPLFTTSKVEGYEPLNASGFSVWTVAGNVKLTLEDGDMTPFLLETNNYGQKVYLAPPKGNSKSATAFEKKQLYAPANLAGMVNKMTQGDNLFNETPALNTLLRLNAGLKGWILLSSFFHHMAGARSWFFGVSHGFKDGKWNPVKSYKAGLDKIAGNHALVSVGVKNGLTLGLQQDYDEGLLQQKGLTEKAMEKLGSKLGLKAVEAGRAFREMASNSLFKKFFAGLKAEAFAIEYVHELQKEPDADPDAVAERVARLINEDFGGLHLQRMGRNPTLQKVSRLLLLAPDWTESNFRAFFGQAPGDRLNKWISKMINDVPPPPGMQKMYRRFWLRVATRTILSTVLAQLLINGRDDDDREDLVEFYRDQFSSWDMFSRMRWTMVDITKLYEVLGLDLEPGKRKMFSVAGHFTDPMKLANPAKLIKGKGSPAVRVADSLFTGSDWAQRPFTGTKDFLETGKTIHKSRFNKKSAFFDRLPAMVVNQVVSMQPIQAGQLIRYWQGEEDGLSALMSSAGAHVSNAWPVDQAKERYNQIAAKFNKASKIVSTNRKYGVNKDEINDLRQKYAKELRLMNQYKVAQKQLAHLRSAMTFNKRIKQTEKVEERLKRIEKKTNEVYEKFNEIYAKAK